MDRMKVGRIIGLVLIAGAIPNIVFFGYAFISSLELTGTGRVATLAAYTESGCLPSNQTMTVTWGQSIAPNSVLTRILWIKNWGGTPQNVSLTATWTPAAADQYMQVTWDREGQTIEAGLALQCTFTLTVYPNITTANPAISDFTHKIRIQGAW